jgi:hypothetical protein
MSILKPNIAAWSDPVYALTADDSANMRISAILNEAAHVFDWHREGLWKSTYKEGFANLLAVELAQRPSLSRKILKLDDRVFSMALYRAIELQKQADAFRAK